jgi:hypothetical protein
MRMRRQIKSAMASKLADDSIQKIIAESNSLTVQVSAIGKQLVDAHQISNQLDAVKKELVDTSSALRSQQRQLADTSELVKMLFARGQSEQFGTGANSDNLLMMPTTNMQLLQQIPTLAQGLVFIRLQGCAYSTNASATVPHLCPTQECLYLACRHHKRDCPQMGSTS